MTAYSSGYGRSQPGRLAHLRRAALGAGEALATEENVALPARRALSAAMRIVIGIVCGLLAFVALAPFFIG